MKSYLEMNTQEMAEAQRTDPAGYAAMVAEIDRVPVAFNAQGQRIFRNGRPVGDSVAINFKNGVQQ